VRWILIVFVGAVVALCLLCGRESETSRARRQPAEIEVSVSTEPEEVRSDASRPVKDPSSEDAPPAETGSEAPPGDPVEDGDSSLFLSLTSAESGKAVRSRINLYRLGAPGNEHWFPGDQLQCRVLVPANGVWIHRLPEGLYRIHSEDQRYESDDPFQFDVRGEITERQFAIPMPRQFRVSLVIVDERGQPIQSARRRAGFASRSRRRVEIPWLQERKLRQPERYSIFVGYGSGGRVGGRRRWREVLAERDAFELGQFWENSRSTRRIMPWRFQVADRTEVQVRQRMEPGRDQVWMALSLPARAIEDAIRLPDGRPATAAKITIVGKAVLVPEPAPSGFWRTLKVNVQVRLAGFKPLDFTANPLNPLGTRVLEAVTASPEE